MREETAERMEDLCEGVVGRIANLPHDPNIKDHKNPTDEELANFQNEMMAKVEADIFDKLTEAERREVFCSLLLWKLAVDRSEERRKQEAIKHIEDLVQKFLQKDPSK